VRGFAHINPDLPAIEVPTLTLRRTREGRMSHAAASIIEVHFGFLVRGDSRSAGVHCVTMPMRVPEPGPYAPPAQAAVRLADATARMNEVPPVFRTADPLGFSAERTGGTSVPSFLDVCVKLSRGGRSYGGHDALTCGNARAEPQISAVRGGASLIRQHPIAS
jgi:hypothetical protein